MSLSASGAESDPEAVALDGSEVYPDRAPTGCWRIPLSIGRHADKLAGVAPTAMELRGHDKWTPGDIVAVSVDSGA